MGVAKHDSNIQKVRDASVPVHFSIFPFTKFATQQNTCIFFSDVRSRPLTFEAVMLKRETLVMRFLLELSLELY